MPPLQIISSGNYYAPVATDPPELKALVKETVGTHVRRIGRFIQLALIGAGRCVAGHQLSPDTAVYLASGRGDLEVTLTVFEQLFREGQAPKPLSFINTVSNAACFYVAQQLQLASRSSFVCNRYFAFESALQLAQLDLERGQVKAALVGVVDVVVPPLGRHREHLEIADEVTPGEASHWLWLGNAGALPATSDAIVAVEHRADRGALMGWLNTQALAADTAISGGQFLDDADLAAIQRELGIRECFDYRSARAYYDSQSGAVVSEFLERAAAGRQLLHINADPRGRYSAFVVRKGVTRP